MTEDTSKWVLFEKETKTMYCTRCNTEEKVKGRFNIFSQIKQMAAFVEKHKNCKGVTL